MPHIHTQPGQIDVTVTMYLFRWRDDVLEMMLHMHKKLNKLLPIGGHIELDETIWRAVAHEMEEESGYELSRVKLLQPKLRLASLDDAVIHPQPVVVNTHEITKGHFHSDSAYAFLVDGQPTKTLAENESSDIRWMTMEDIDKLSDAEIYSNVSEICHFIVDNFSEWDIVETNSYSLDKLRGK